MKPFVWVERVINKLKSCAVGWLTSTRHSLKQSVNLWRRNDGISFPRMCVMSKINLVSRCECKELGLASHLFGDKLSYLIHGCSDTQFVSKAIPLVWEERVEPKGDWMVSIVVEWRMNGILLVWLSFSNFISGLVGGVILKMLNDELILSTLLSERSELYKTFPKKINYYIKALPKAV